MTDGQTVTEQTEQTAKPAKSAKPRRTHAAKPATANDMAARLTKRLGRQVTAKSVRQWVRDNVAAYNDERYTPHAYDGRMQQAIESAFVARTPRAVAAKRSK